MAFLDTLGALPQSSFAIMQWVRELVPRVPLMELTAVAKPMMIGTPIMGGCCCERSVDLAVTVPFSPCCINGRLFWFGFRQLRFDCFFLGAAHCFTPTKLYLEVQGSHNHRLEWFA
jgi:hypothetical protein